MARFHCRACGEEGTFVYDGRRDCPQCGSVDVQLAIGVEETGRDWFGRYDFIEMVRALDEADLIIDCELVDFPEIA
jgi:hypothetical protein